MALPARMLATALWLGGFLGAASWLTIRSASANAKQPTVTVADSAVLSRERIALGRRFFEDTRLSLDSSISCATCHQPHHAFAEPRAVSQGIGVRARTRNAPSLVDVAAFHPSFDWDGRASTLEAQLNGVFAVDGDFGLDALTVVARLSADTSYVAHFQRAFNRPPDTAGLLSALVAFQASLTSGQSRFERYYLQGDSTALSASERRGWDVFRSSRSGCDGCHIPLPDPGGSGILIFGDGLFHNLGVGYKDGRYLDAGRFAVTSHASDLGAFRTPSLRNAALTAPYMHDGSIATLEDVVEFYAQGGTPNPHLDGVMFRRDLTQQDKADLVAFLRALTTTWLTDSMTVRRRIFSF